jgi:tetratricopeptide (TPR) repeat protein
LEWPERVALISRKTAQYALIVLAGLLPVMVNPAGVDTFTQPKAALVGIVTVLLLASWLVEGLASGTLRFPKTPVDIPLAIYFVCVIAATIFSLNFRLSTVGPYKWREGLVYLLSYGVIFYGAVIYLRGRTLRRALVVAGIGGLVVFLYAVAQWLGLDFTTWVGATQRVFSTLGSPLYLGGYTVLVVPIALATAFASPKGSSGRMVAATVTLLGVAASALSFSRGAWLGVLAAFAVMVALAPDRRRVAGWVIAAVLVLVVVAGAPVARAPGDFGARLKSFVSVSGENAPRVALWQGALRIAADHPWFGVGPEVFKQEFALIKPPNWPAIDPEDKSARAHSAFLNTAATTGVPSAIAMLAALAILIGRGLWLLSTKKGLRALFGDDGEHASGRVLLAGMLGAVVGYVVFLQVAFTMVDLTPFFWVIAGAFVAATANLGQGRQWREARMPALMRGWPADVSIGAVIALLAVSIWFFLSPVVADTYFAHALSAQSVGRVNTAFADLNTALYFAPDEPNYLFFLGKSYMTGAEQSKNPVLVDLAEKAYLRAIALDPADTMLLDALGNAYYIGWTRYQRTQDAAPADTYFRRVLDYDRTDATATERLGEIAFRNGDLGSALAYFQRAVLLSPSSSTDFYNLGLVYENQGRFADALSEYARAVELDPTNQVAVKARDDMKRKLAAQPKPR